MTYPYGVQIAVVRVDADTGQAAVERFLLAYDIGRSINPMLVEGQLVGGFVQGLGGALYEEFRYDESGQPLSVTLADYLLPTARETLAVEVLVTEDAPSPPQTASVGVSTTRFVRNEGAVIRHNMGWTFFLLAYLVLIGIACYFLFPGVMALSV
jgi:aerobic carbon-monoxide dehydrogenase large subunit